MFPQTNIPLFRAKSATENTRNYCHQDRLQVQKRVPPKKRPGEQDDVECVDTVTTAAIIHYSANETLNIKSISSFLCDCGT